MQKTLAACLLSFSALACMAAPPSAESIDTLLSVTKSESMVESMYGNLEQTMRQAMDQAAGPKPPSAEQKRVLDAAPKQFMKVIKEELSWATLKPVYVQIYQESFTQEELDGLIAFYRSPAGHAFIEKMPAVMQKSMAYTQSRIAPLMEKMKAAMDKAMADAKLKK